MIHTIKKYLLLGTLLISLLFFVDCTIKQIFKYYFTQKYSSAGYKTKILLVWGQGTGEQEQTQRFMLAAKNLNLDLKVVSAQPKNWFYRRYLGNMYKFAVETMQPNFNLIIERNISAMPGIPNYLVLDRGINAYFKHKNGKYVPNNPLMGSFAGFLPTFPELEQLRLALEQQNLKFYGFNWYPTVYATNYTPQPAKKLFYPGGVLKDNTRGSDKYKNFFTILDKYGYLQVTGLKSKWRHTPNSIQDQIPFDGKSLLKQQNAAGISLVLHDKEHFTANVPTGRIFEAAAANTVIISDRLKFIEEHFGNNILYIDVDQDAESMAKQVDKHVQWIVSHPELARSMAERCHAVFLNKFTLEQQLQKLLDLDQLIKLQENKIINPPVDTVELFRLVKKIPINEFFTPEYNYTTNSGLMRDPTSQGYILALHTETGSSTRYYQTKLHLFRLNDNFEPVQHTQINQEQYYKFYKNHWSFLSVAQDPRLFADSKQIYMLYNDSVTSPFREVFVGKVHLDAENISASDVGKINHTIGLFRDQKNWTPFVYQEQIYFIYTTDPHRILSWDPNTNEAKLQYDNGHTFAAQWPFGDIRGGTPAIYVKDLDAYLTFFHSSLRYREREPEITKIHQPRSLIYYTGAMLFESKPPFKVIAFTPKPLSFAGMYNEENANYHIIFPCGLIEEENSFLISAGVQDIKTVLLRVNKKDLYQQFKYIKNKENKNAA